MTPPLTASRVRTLPGSPPACVGQVLGLPLTLGPLPCLPRVHAVSLTRAYIRARLASTLVRSACTRTKHPRISLLGFLRHRKHDTRDHPAVAHDHPRPVFAPRCLSHEPGAGSNLMLSDDDGGPEEGIYARFPAGALDHDAIIWSGWDEVVWDCSTERVREVLNLLLPTIGTVVNAAVLPFPTVALDDLLAEERPLGILTSNPDELVIYSLRTHTVIKQIPFNSPKAIQASNQFLVISTISPPTLHVLDAAAFNIIHTITAPKLALPIVSLSRRLLAYASTPPPPSASPTPTAASQSPSKVQADISMVLEGARKVGAGIWSGVQTLGDSAASRSPASPLTRSPAPMSPTSRTLLGTPRMYSRSAPADSTCSTPTPSPHIALPTTGETRPISSQGHVTVLDLAPLLTNRARSGSVSPAFAPRRIVQHHATPGQAITALSFSSLGSMLAVSGADGVYIRVFEVRPKGRYSKGGPRLAAQDDPSPLEGRDTGSLWHWYDLQRGVTRR
ncbi:hypothetical protein FRC10_010102 [Ceratobasidium sp. 414]|nr:hypothetical protein FRC10_010102 [Ceratobasidium sp. 414]